MVETYLNHSSSDFRVHLTYELLTLLTGVLLGSSVLGRVAGFGGSQRERHPLAFLLVDLVKPASVQPARGSSATHPNSWTIRNWSFGACSPGLVWSRHDPRGTGDPQPSCVFEEYLLRLFVSGVAVVAAIIVFFLIVIVVVVVVIVVLLFVKCSL